MRIGSKRVYLAIIRKRVFVAFVALSFVAAALCAGRTAPAAAAGPSSSSSQPGPSSSQLAPSPRRAADSRQLRGAEAARFLRESGISDALDGASAGGFVEQGKLLASDGAAQDSHGFSVAISGDYAVVGAPADATGANTRQGAAYVYARSGSTWAQQQKLTASDAVANDEFGYAVAIGGDTIFVGRRFTQVGNAARTRGAVYVFTRSGTTWTQAPTPLVSSDIADADLFGASLAYEGGTLLVGAPQKNNGTTFFRGAAYVFTGAGATWTQQAKLLADDGGFADFFGWSVAVSGDTAVVGAPGQVGSGAAGGRGWAYVYTRAGAAWSQQQKLLASDGEAGDAFGFSVAVSGETAVVGARLDMTNGVGAQGSAYVYTRAGAAWTERQKLLGVETTQRNDNFGYAVAIKNDTIAVGSPAHEVLPGIANHGAVYVFARAGAAWARQQKLIHSDASSDALGQAVAFDGGAIIAGAPAKTSARGAAYVFAFAQNGSVKLTSDDGAANDRAGTSVAISGDTAVVGAPFAGVAGQAGSRGAAYVFVRANQAWALQAKLTASDGASGDEFGASVAVSGDTVIVGAPLDDTGQSIDHGSAYVFTRSGTTWTQGPAKLTAADGASGDRFGEAVALEGDTAAVGAFSDNLDADNFGEGSVHVFARGASGFAFQQKIAAPNLAGLPNFGRALAVSGETLVVGAQGDTVGNANELARGAAYVFVRAGATWAQQARLDIGDVAFDEFGASVAVSGDTAAVGAPIHDHGPNSSAGSNQGAVFVFVRAGTTWTQQQKLTASDAAVGDQLGSSVAVSGDTVVAGARLKDFGAGANTQSSRGAAYVFTRAGATWTENAKLLSFDGAAQDQFGRSAALSGTTAVVGAWLDDVEGRQDQGSAHVFTVASGGGGSQTVVQFSSAAANVSEGFTPPSLAGGGGVGTEANSVTVTVTRTGDTTGTTFVRYAPAAADGSVGCAAATGTALPRCDYTGATGTLRFDPGQTEKPVRVFVTDDSFMEGAETFSLVLSAPQGATLGAQASVSVTLGDNDTDSNAPNPIDGHGFFVRTQYTDFLGREPEPSGYQAWLSVLNDCPNPTNDAACDRVTVASSFFRSQEYEQKGFFVFRFYKASLGRMPLYAEFAADLSRLSGDTAEQVNAARAAFPGEFAARDEFRARYDALSNAAYVDALSQTAGVDLGARRQQLKDQLGAGTLTRAGVLREVIETQEVIAKEYHAGFVASLYFGFLGRDPEPTGYRNWLDYLDAHPDDFRTMVNGFVNSREYRLRFGRAD